MTTTKLCFILSICILVIQTHTLRRDDHVMKIEKNHLDNSHHVENDLNDENQDMVVVNHVKNIINEVIDNVVMNQTEDNEFEEKDSPTVYVVYDDDDNTDLDLSSSSSVTINSKSTFQNNSHLIVIENGDVSIFVIKKEDSERKSQSTGSSQTLSSNSYGGQFKNVSFSQVSANPSSEQKTNNSNQQLSDSNELMHFINASHQIFMENGHKNSVLITNDDDIDDNWSETNTELPHNDTENTETTNSSGNTSTTTTSTTSTTTTITTSTSITTTAASATTTKKTTIRTTPAPPPTTTTRPPTILQAVAESVGAAMATFTGFASLNPLYLLLGKRRKRSFSSFSNSKHVGKTLQHA